MEKGGDLFRLCTLDETNDMESYAAAENLRHAWHQWELYSCEERGGHWWMLVGDHPDDWGEPGEGRASLSCACCPATTDDLAGPDGFDFIQGEVGNISIRDGRHDHHEDFEVAVTARVHVEQYGPNLDMIYPEYDIYIEVEPREKP